MHASLHALIPHCHSIPNHDQSLFTFVTETVNNGLNDYVQARWMFSSKVDPHSRRSIISVVDQLLSLVSTKCTSFKLPIEAVQYSILERGLFACKLNSNRYTIQTV